MNDRSLLSRTRLAHAGKTTDYPGGKSVNPPLVRLSTVLFEDLAQMRELRARRDQERVLTYGARGNPTAFALEDLVTELEGGHRTRLFCTGLAAVAQTFLAYLRPGDHLLVTDAVYEPVRNLARQLLAPQGIEVEYYAADGSDLEGRLRANTRMVYAEIPGSLVLELCDLPALAALCRPRNILLAVDNTWGSGYLLRPLQLGADISIIALTKYLGGHSDVMMGSVCTHESSWPALARMSDAMGQTVSPDDAWLILRGARTLAARLRLHQEHAAQVATWLQAQPAVARVYWPALPEHPQHALWLRDFHGCNGLLSFELRDANADITTLVDGLQLFGIGASWGGYESLVTITDLPRARSVGDWSSHGPILRLHIGLEDPDELIEDLAQGFRSAGL